MKESPKSFHPSDSPSVRKHVSLRVTQPEPLAQHHDGVSCMRGYRPGARDLCHVTSWEHFSQAKMIPTTAREGKSQKDSTNKLQEQYYCSVV